MVKLLRTQELYLFFLAVFRNCNTVNYFFLLAVVKFMRLWLAVGGEEVEDKILCDLSISAVQ